MRLLQHSNNYFSTTNNINMVHTRSLQAYPKSGPPVLGSVDTVSHQILEKYASFTGCVTKT